MDNGYREKAASSPEDQWEWNGHRIGGSWVKTPAGDQDRKFSVNPSHGTRLMNYTISREVVHRAIEAADHRGKELRKLSYADRLELLRRLAIVLGDMQPQLIHAMQVESGKPAWDAVAEYSSAMRYLEWLSRDFESVVERLLIPSRLNNISGTYSLKPVGVAISLVTFANPVTTFVSNFAAALLAGCPLVLFGTEHSAVIALQFAQVEEKLQTNGLFGVVFATFDYFKLAAEHGKVAGVIYAGPKETCDELRKSAKIAKRNQRFLVREGGKNSVLVHSSAQLTEAVDIVLAGTFRTAGQLCSSTSRVFVYRSLLEDFVGQLEAAVTAMKIGPTDVDAVDPYLGPLRSKEAVEQFLRFQTMANREDGKTLQWGRAHETLGDGYFVQPGVRILAEFDPKSVYQNTVLFCPDLAIYSYDILKDAIACINADEAWAVSFLGDPAILKERSSSLQALNIILNAPTVEVEAQLPLGNRGPNGQLFSGIAMAYYLSYPQVIVDSEEYQKLTSAWPKG